MWVFQNLLVSCVGIGKTVRESRSAQVLGKRIAVTQADEELCLNGCDRQCWTAHPFPMKTQELLSFDFSDTVTHQPVLIIVFLHLLQCSLC